MTSKEYKTLKELDGFLNELRILLYDKFYKKEIDEISKSMDKDNLNNSVDKLSTNQCLKLTFRKKINHLKRIID